VGIKEASFKQTTPAQIVINTQEDAMNRWLRSSMFSFVLLFTLAISAFWTVPVLADDGSPPEPAAEETMPPVEDGSAAEVTDETSPVEAPVIEEAPSQEEIVPELLASVPDGTEVVVVNEEGENVPLVTQEAADAIEFIDPVWCPTGVTPQNGTGGCTTSYGNLKLLVDALIAGTAGVNPAANGIIWIQGGTDVDSSGTPIVIDGSDPTYNTWENFSLTLKGGWNGLGTTTVNTANPSVFDQSISIINWNGDVTLSDIIISGAATGSALRSAALDIETTKKIVLTNVQVNANTGAGTVNGAVLDNEDATAAVFGDVTITNSTFNDNDDIGLKVESEGMITLAGVLANGNDSLGAYLRNHTASTPKSVVITTGTNEFSNNLNDGLQIDSAGSVTLKDIDALNNSTMGIRIDNKFGSAASAVTLTGTTIVSGNITDGINVASDGIITVSNLVANLNGGSGAILNNSTAATALGVTVSGSSQFKFNSSDGLNISSNGAILANNITSYANSGGAGAIFDNDGFVGGSASVTLTGTNSFKENSSAGLTIYSDGLVTLSNITASDNLSDNGLYVDNSSSPTPKAVTLTGTNQFNFNAGAGLSVSSDGTITISNLTANGNLGGPGATLDNDGAPSPQNVTLTGTMNVSSNSSHGLLVNTLGAISIGAITANSNSGSGVELYNASGSLPKTVALSGASNNFNGNSGGSGLYIESLGAVTLNNVTAGDNDNFGLYVDNSWVGAAGGITLNGTSAFFYNGDSGIQMRSTGNILIKDLDSTGNGIDQIAGDGFGAYLQNNYVGFAGSVMVGTTKAGWFNGFSDNFSSGLEIYSNGTVTLSNITADGNGLDNTVDTPYGYGLYVNNTSASMPKAVTLNGTNQFNGNYGGGVYLISDGAITVNKLTANDNLDGGGLGALLANTTANPLVPQNVTLNGYGDFSGNGSRGLEVQTYGLVTLNSIYADSNGSDGVFVDNYTGGSLLKAVTINGYADVSNNSGYGLYILSRGAIKVNNLDASLGNANGAWLDNDEAGAVGGITLTGSNDFSYNAGNGLLATSRGTIMINDLDAIGNVAGFGAQLDNINAAASPGITLTNTTAGASFFAENGAAGLLVFTKGAVTITKLIANDNGEIGAFINNASSTAASVTLIGYGEFNTNGDDGLGVLSYGAITANNLTAIDNGQNADPLTGWGVFIDNRGSVAKPVTINGTNIFNENFQDGLEVFSLGLIKTNNLTASSNSGAGANLDNQWNFGSFGVTLTGVNVFESNSLDGLLIYSNGAVTASNISANSNTLNGAYIHAYNDTAPVSKVTLTGNNTFNFNGDGVTGGGEEGTGLYVQADYVITLNNLTANGNTEEGAHIYGYDGSALAWYAPMSLKLTGINTFNDNGTDGLYFESPGNVDISRITADVNGGDGVDGSSEYESITISCGSMTDNTGYGWDLQVLYPGEIITLTGVFSLGNTLGDVASGALTIVRTCPLP
jgi:hypothetical protein